MGFFSWVTSDSKRSISNSYADNRQVFKVHMITRDGRVFTEEKYEGYGEFGGKDYYELVAELNGAASDRQLGINIAFNGNPSGEVNGFKAPKFVERLYIDPAHYKNDHADPEYLKKFSEWFDTLPESQSCEFQGFFYPDEYEDDGEYEEEDESEEDY